ncbi:alkaline phosphatase [Pedobacter metabolipauper]|uniref:Alkaline phosphatase n=1 Tax=Pedobacter metabolipauper TaxID=425513 RepID=A0A4R6SQS3_9SPHI|nr:alkaline phosphatase [Pedobacter metabolipauper]TDQ07111.1 alkaline phosphatase [Pedobacter metabolipauper]
MKYLVIIAFSTLSTLLMLNLSANAQVKRTENSGHSHNDYNQNFPFFMAYYAGMGSVEADVFIKNGKLLVAHNEEDTDPDKTLESLYLLPIAKLFKQNQGHIYTDTSKKMQLVIDIKANHKDVLAVLINELKPNLAVFNPKLNKNAVRIVISGDVPPAVNFKDFPDYIYFDGRPDKIYTPEQLGRIAMISDDISSYVVWNGKGTPTPPDRKALVEVIGKAHSLNKPFRFWATKDNPNTWKELEHLGADWIGTDHPQKLNEFYSTRDRLEYINPLGYKPYEPSYKRDGSTGNIRNVILLIGDGMGLAQIQAGLSSNFGTSNLSKIRYIGLSRTEAMNSDFTDSAAGATAMASGEKTNNRYIGVDIDGRPMGALPDTLAAFGMKSGIISSGDITDATPAAFYAHQIERSMSQEIAADLANSHVDILVGSNRKSFVANKDKTLMSRLTNNGFSYSKTLEEFKIAKSGKQLVLLDDSATRRVLDGRGEMLKTSLLKTIELLSANKAGFFIMAEGAQIDHGGHANDLPFAVTEQHDFDRLVGEALKFADQNGETLVIVTADHETGGLSLLDASYKKGMVRGNFSTDDHTNIMVPVFAYGPGATNFMGTYNNNQIYYKILKALKK